MLVVHFALGELLQASHKRKAALFAKDGPRFVSLNGSPYWTNFATGWPVRSAGNWPRRS